MGEDGVFRGSEKRRGGEEERTGEESTGEMDGTEMERREIASRGSLIQRLEFSERIEMTVEKNITNLFRCCGPKIDRKSLYLCLRARMGFLLLDLPARLRVLLCDLFAGHIPQGYQSEQCRLVF